MTAPEGRWLDVDGVRVRLFAAGQGSPLLVLHGAGGCRWEPWMDAAARRHRLLLPEHPWFGLSDDTGEITTVADLAFHCARVLDLLDPGPVHLAGFSLGGWVAAELAAWQPERLATLTLVDAAGLYGEGERLDVFQMDAEDVPARVYVHPERAAPPLGAPEEMGRIAVRNRIAAARFGWERWDDPKLARRLRRAAVPALIVWGEQDRLFPLSQGEAFRDAIAGSRLAVVPEAGHNPAVDQPERFLEAVEPLWSGVTAAAERSEPSERPERADRSEPPAGPGGGRGAA